MNPQRMAKRAMISLLASLFGTGLILVAGSAGANAASRVLVTQAGDPKDKKKATTPAGRRRANQADKAKRAPKRPSRSGMSDTKKTQPRKSTPGRTRPVEAPTEAPSMELDIPPAESIVPPEEKMYRFGFVDATFAEVVGAFARQTGLGVLGEAPKGGEVNFVTPEPLAFKEALSRIRLILFNSSSLDPYWIERAETQLIVKRMADLTRALQEDRMFRTMDALRKADLPDDELVFVIYKPDRPLDDIRVARDFLPDYVRITPLPGQTSLTIFALVKDVKKYLRMIGFVAKDGDPRQLVRIEVEHLLPSRALETLGRLMKLGSSAAPPSTSRASRTTSASRARAREPNPLDTMKAPEVVIIPYDEQGYFVVHAMQDKIDEIKKMLAFIDVPDPSAPELTPVVINVENADPAELIDTLRQIISHTPAVTVEAVAKKATRRVQPGRKVSKTFSADGVLMFVHPARDAIVVIAPEESLAQIRRLIKQFDVSTKIEGIRITVKHKDPNEITTTLGLVYGGGSSKGQPKFDRFKVVPDSANSAIWFSGPESELPAVREMIASLDVPGDEISLHIYQVKHQVPSFVSNMLREYVGNQGATGKPKKGAKPTRSRALSVSKFTADDERGLFFVICTDAEWEEYLPLIAQLDRKLNEQAPFDRLAVQHLEPSDAVYRLSALLSDNPAMKGIRYAPSDGAILVIGASAKQLQDVKTFLVEIDRPVVKVHRIFEIRHRDPGMIKTAIEALVGGSGDTRGKSSRSKPGKQGAVVSTHGDLLIVELGERLLVSTTPEKMTEVAKHIYELDIPENESVTKIYDFEPGINIESIADQLSAVLSGSSKPGKTKRGVSPRSAEGAQFISQPEVGKMVVIAPPDMIPRIEELLEVLRVAPDIEPDMVALIQLDYADPETLVGLITPLLDIKVRALVGRGELVNTDESSTSSSKSTTRRKTKPASATERFHIDADVHNQRLIVAGPAAIVAEARRLVAKFDRRNATEVIFRIVDLENSSAAEVVKAIKEMMGSPGRRSTRARAGDSSKASPLEPDVLTVVEAPGGRAVVLNGPTRDVEMATERIRVIDEQATRGREIRVFRIENADIAALAELILNVVDIPPKTGARKAARPRKAAAELLDDDMSYELTKTWTSADLYLRADFVASTLLAVAPASKIAEIADVIEKIDQRKEGDGPLDAPLMPKLMYELKNREDAFDAVFDFEMFLDAVWDPPGKLPKVDYAPIGNIIVVRYHDESRFPEINELLTKYIDVHKPGFRAFRKKGFQVPSEVRASEFVQWLVVNHPELDIDATNISSTKDETWGVPQLEPYQATAVKPCYLPHTLLRAVDHAILVSAAVRNNDAAGAQEEEKPASNTTDDVLRAAAQTLLGRDQTTTEDGGDEPEQWETRDLDSGSKLKVYFNDETGEVTVEGPTGIIDDIPDWIEEMKEEFKDLQLPPDIRIYRVRYIDVYTAAEILGEMFNATRQQIQQQQRAAQQQARQRQQQQRQQQRQQQAQQQQQSGRTAQQRQPARGQQQQQAAVPQLPPTSVRIYPNPRDRSLILRADATQYPVIRKLLATIDRPQPVSSEFRVFKLEKLNATDVEVMLRDFLGLEGSARSARQPARQAAGGAQGRQPARSTRRASGSGGGRLPRTITQTTTDGELGIDPKDIKLSSNEATNTIIAMAPIRALDYIGELIKQFESEDVPERLTKYYDLEHAQAETVAEHLATHFESESGVPGSREGRKGGSKSRSSLNTPSFLPYPPLNMLTVLATADQLEEIDDVIARLDIRGEQHEWKDITLEYAKAETVAGTLTSLFGDSSAARSGGRGTGGGIGPKFIASDSGRTVFFNAPESLHERIMEKVATLEEEAKDSTSLRVIELVHARASDVATAIGEAYGRGRGARGASDVQFTISAHDPSKRLFVRADKQLFSEIESLVESLDKPPTLGFEFRIFPLQYADARRVNAQMTSLMKDFMSRLDPSERKAMAAFSVDVDERANALVVLGTPTVFGFLEKNLPKIDNVINKLSPQSSTMIALINAEAGEVATSITQLWSEKNIPAGDIPPQVMAIRTQNAVLIRGTEAQIAEIMKEVIEPLEEQIPPDQITKSIALERADPGQLESAIAKLFGGGGKNPQDRVISVADYGTNSIIVSASARNMKRVEELVVQFDDVKTEQQEVHVVTLENVDAAAVAKTLTDMFIRSMPKPKGGQAAPLTITALTGSKALLVKSRPEAFAEIETVITELDKSDAQLGEEVRVVSLLYSDVSEMHQAMKDYLRKPGGGGKGAQLAGDVRLSALTHSNSLVISGTKEQVDRLESTLKKLDAAGEQGSVPQVIPLEHVEAVEIVASLQEMFGDKSSRRGQTPPVIIANEAANTLIVRAGPSDFVAITGMVKQLDTDNERPPNFKIIQVAQGVNVTDLAEKVEQTINDSARAQTTGRGRDVPSITITPDTRRAVVILAGSSVLFDDAEDMIQAMAEMGPSGGTTMRIIKLGNVSADDVLRLIERLKGDSGGTGRSSTSKRRSSSSSRPRPKRPRP